MIRESQREGGKDYWYRRWVDDVLPSVDEDEREVAFSFVVIGSNLYAAWKALANLADMAGEASISARAKLKSGFDKNNLENGVSGAATGTRLINEGQD